jgi:hypothetical protein
MAEHANQQPLDTATFLRIRKWYILALSGIALMIIIAQVLIQQHLSSQLSDSRVINVAGRQRAYSQKLVKEALILTEREDAAGRGQILEELKQTLALWKTAHQGLRTGNDSLGLPVEDDPEILKLYDEVQPHHQAMVLAAEQMLAQLADPSYAVPRGFSVMYAYCWRTNATFCD